MRCVIVYHSSTGFTKKYASWLAESLEAEIFAYKEAKNLDISSYDLVLFGTWAKAGGFFHLSWLEKKLQDYSNKKFLAFVVGASPADSEDINVSLANTFKTDSLEKVPYFYCPGGLNYEAMPMLSSLMMKFFLKGIQTKLENNEISPEMANMVSHSYDISDRSYLNPIISYVKSLENGN